MEQLLEILKQMHPDVDFESDVDLVADEVLDSLDIVTLITEINNTFDVSIPAEEIVPENFCNAEAIWALIERLDEE
jgi:acyl carrier protein